MDKEIKEKLRSIVRGEKAELTPEEATRILSRIRDIEVWEPHIRGHAY